MRALPCIMLIALLATSEIIAQTGAHNTISAASDDDDAPSI